MVLIAAGIVGVYLLLLFFPIVAWQQMPFTSAEKYKGKVSVIIPFRNEEANLKRLVEALKVQTYPWFEVLFVNDHSTDDSLNVLRRLVEKDIPFSFSIISLEGTQGKKAAIAAGIAQATGEIIVTTDADCWFDRNWLLAMTSGFNNSQTQMVTGPVVSSFNLIHTPP